VCVSDGSRGGTTRAARPRGASPPLAMTRRARASAFETPTRGRVRAPAGFFVSPVFFLLFVFKASTDRNGATAPPRPPRPPPPPPSLDGDGGCAPPRLPWRRLMQPRQLALARRRPRVDADGRSEEGGRPSLTSPPPSPFFFFCLAPSSPLPVAGCAPTGRVSFAPIRADNRGDTRACPAGWMPPACGVEPRRRAAPPAGSVRRAPLARAWRRAQAPPGPRRAARRQAPARSSTHAGDASRGCGPWGARSPPLPACSHPTQRVTAVAIARLMTPSARRRQGRHTPLPPPPLPTAPT